MKTLPSLCRHLPSILLLFGVAFGPASRACRIVLPARWIWPPPPHPPPRRPPPRPAIRPLEVKSHRASIRIRRQIAEVTVRATFRNPNPRRIEGTYLFPVGPRAAVSSFAITMNGKTVEAELLPAGKAREIYEDIVRRMRDPALLEYLDQGLLKARIFPIEPRSEVSIQLTYETTVSRDDGLYRWRYPLLSARPGGEQKLRSLAIEVIVDSETPLKNVFVPGFDVEVERKGAQGTRIAFEASDYRPDRDFEIMFSENKEPVGIDFLAYRKGKEGYFLMFVAPDSELQAEELGAKEMIFVVDTSGSMMGKKIEQVKQSLAFCVNALGKEDTFNIIGFATDVHPFADAPVPAAAENRERARAFISELRARGGTAIDSALRNALDTSPPKGNRIGMLVLLTDGLPTVGETDPAVILRTAGKVVGNRRIFTLGVGYDVNTRLLDGLAGKTRGYSSYVRPKEDLEIALSSFYGKIAHPVMTNLALDTKGVRFSDVNPSELPDVFKGGQLLITGRYKGKGTKGMVLSGDVRRTRESFRFQVDLDGDRRNAFIPRMWAVSRVAYLQEQMKINGPDEELIDEIKRLGRSYGILTQYTSFLVVEEAIDRQRLSEARAAFDAAEAAAGNTVSGRGAVEGAIRMGLMKTSPGQALSMAPEAMPEAVRTAYRRAGVRSEDIRKWVKQAGDKTFYLRKSDGYWYDSLIPTGQTQPIDREVEAWSTEFMQLLRSFPSLRRYLLVSDRLVVRIGGVTLRVTSASADRETHP